MSPVMRIFSTAVKNQTIINNIVSAVLKSYKIEHPKLHYTSIEQEYHKKHIDNDRKLIKYLKRHPVVLTSNLLDYEKMYEN